MMGTLVIVQNKIIIVTTYFGENNTRLGFEAKWGASSSMVPNCIQFAWQL